MALSTQMGPAFLQERPVQDLPVQLLGSLLICQAPRQCSWGPKTPGWRQKPSR